MKVNNIVKGGIAAVFASSCLVAAAATWSNFTANTPDTAYSWNDPGNWEGGEAPDLTDGTANTVVQLIQLIGQRLDNR